MDQALFISKRENLSYFTPDFTRIYFGQEFCERLMPGAKDLAEVLAFADEQGVGFSLVTPYVTNKGLDALEKLLPMLAERRPDAEVVCNDWGVLHLLRSDYPVLVPVLGRLLNKNKRGPRIMNIIDKVPPETRDYFVGTNLDVPAAAGFLKKRGVYRVEFDNLLQGLDLDKADPEIHKSLYLPFAFVSTTRFCLTANCDSAEGADYVGIMPCGRECKEYTFGMANPVMGMPLIRKGNTLFFINETIPEVVNKGGVDRVVIQPEIPI